jgi:hypothetical protein
MSNLQFAGVKASICDVLFYFFRTFRIELLTAAMLIVPA